MKFTRQLSTLMLAAVAAVPAQAITGGTATAAFAAVGTGVQVTPDWVITAAHAAIAPGGFYGNGYGLRQVAAVYTLPGAGAFPEDDIALLRLLPDATGAGFLPVLGEALAEGPIAPALAVTITSALNHSPRGYGFTSVNEAAASYDDDGSGPLPPVRVNWLVSLDAAVQVQGGDSGGGLFAGHVLDSSVLVGISSASITDDAGLSIGSAFVQPAAYRGWIDATMAADLADTQLVAWSAAAVPEPAPAALFAAGALLLALRPARRARRRA